MVGYSRSVGKYCNISKQFLPMRMNKNFMLIDHSDRKLAYPVNLRQLFAESFEGYDPLIIM